jgi:serine/threonine protein kinase
MAVARESGEYGRFLVAGTTSGGSGIACVRGDDQVYAVDRVVIPDPARRERERQRLSRAAGISHANVIENVEVSVQGNELQVVTSHVAGISLDMIEARDPDPRSRLILPVLIDVLYGLHAIHARGLVHGRVCPANVLVGTDGVARIAGLHRASTDPTIVYAAPEQTTSDADLDGRADVFSLGVLLWSSLTGKVLYQAGEDRTMIYARDVPRPSAIGRRPPAILDSIVLKALALDPAERFASAEEMAHALRDVAIKTSCLGTSDEVGDWVTRLFGAELDDQRAIVQRARSTAMPVHAVPESVATSLPSRREPRGSHRNVALVSVLAALLVGAVLAWQWHARSAIVPVEVAPAGSPIAITLLDLHRVPPPPPPATAIAPATPEPAAEPAAAQPPATSPPVTVAPRTTVTQPQRPVTAVKRVPPRPIPAQPHLKSDDVHEAPAKPAATTPLENNPYVYK